MKNNNKHSVENYILLYMLPRVGKLFKKLLVITMISIFAVMWLKCSNKCFNINCDGCTMTSFLKDIPRDNHNSQQKLAKGTIFSTSSIQVGTSILPTKLGV